MKSIIDEVFWREALSQPTWYLILSDDFKRLERLARAEPDYAKRKQIKDKAYGLVERAVVDGRLPMATHGEAADAERRPVDTIVVHHTNNRPGMTLERLNAMQLLRIYGREYANPENPKQHHLKGEPVWSGHFYESRQVFWCYHWFVRADGTAVRILPDDAIGWQAGNWDINTRSVAICIDDELSHKAPDTTVMDSLAEIIRTNYPQIRSENIIGHCDANRNTECPGYLFRQTWRRQLLNKLYD